MSKVTLSKLQYMKLFQGNSVKYNLVDTETDDDHYDTEGVMITYIIFQCKFSGKYFRGEIVEFSEDILDRVHGTDTEYQPICDQVEKSWHTVE